MSREIIATIVTDKVVEKTYAVENENVVLATFIRDCIHRDYGKRADIKGVDYEDSELPIMFPDYYCDWQHITWGNMYPFILKSNKVEWIVPFDEVTVEEFARTHDIAKNKPIKVNVGGGIGGLGGDFFPFAEWLSALLPYLDVLKDGIGQFASIITIMQAFKGRDGTFIDPREAREFFRSRKQWTREELESVTGVEDATNLTSVLEYSEFKNDNDRYHRQRCSETKHLEQIERENQNLWGQYEFNGTVNITAAQIYDINKLLTEIMILSQELNSDAFGIASKLLDAFYNEWPFVIHKGEPFKFLQLLLDVEVSEDYEMFSEDLYRLSENLSMIRSFLINKWECRQ